MKGDFTRTTFDPTNHFCRVLMQQGRVTLDADPNEQTAILLHCIRTLARDVIGPHAGPTVGLGFTIRPDPQTGFTIGAGRYYVDGILCENEAPCGYASQPDYTPPPDDALLKELKDLTGQLFGLYLDVWERHITHLDTENIREKALGGPDTCTRAKVVWQVKALPLKIENDAAVEKKLDQLNHERAALEAELKQTSEPTKIKELNARLAEIKKAIASIETMNDVPPPEELDCDSILHRLASGGCALSARVEPGHKTEDPCITSPEARYRGAENQLYRVEIHNGGAAGSATFKWSRNNGSIATRWLGTQGHALQVGDARGFRAGSWVELSDDVQELRGWPGLLVRLANVEPGQLSVDPSSLPGGATLAWSEQLLHPKVRCWDHVEIGDIVLTNGAIPIVEAETNEPNWFDLEDGIQVQFAPNGQYRTGDYWLIPARVATGSIEWPFDSGGVIAKAIPPQGIEHHYAPLAFIASKNQSIEVQSCQCEIEPINSCYPATAPSAPHIVTPAARSTRDALSTSVTPQRKQPKKTARRKKESRPSQPTKPSA